MQNYAVILGVLTFILRAQAASGQTMPVGGEFQINSFTTDRQNIPSVALNTDGDFVVVWESFAAADDVDGFSIQGQRYSSDGSVLGGQFQVNTYTTNRQRWPIAVTSGTGNWVVVWSSLGSAGTDTSSYSIQAQRFDSSGGAIGAEFQVNSYTSSQQSDPGLAVDTNGGFIVVWESLGSTGNDSSTWSIQAQRYNSSGGALGSEFQVNTYTTSNQVQPSVGIGPAGDFVVVWYSLGSAGDDLGYSIHGQRFSSAGNATGVEFQINTYSTNDQWLPSLAVEADGDFIVVWESDGSASNDNSGSSIQGRRYGSDGNAVGPEFQVNSFTSGDQRFAVVDSDADGNFLVFWQSFGSSGSDSSLESIIGQAYNSNGVPAGSEFQVNSYTMNGQAQPGVSFDGGDNFVVVWHSSGSSGNDSSDLSVQGQRFNETVAVTLQSFSLD